jgi:hypothetical protein
MTWRFVMPGEETWLMNGVYDAMLRILPKSQACFGVGIFFDAFGT